MEKDLGAVAPLVLDATAITLGSETQGQDRVKGSDDQGDGEENIAEKTNYAPTTMHIVLDDDLHAKAHMPKDGEERHCERDGDQRMLNARHQRRTVGAQMPEDKDDEEDDERD